MRPSDFAAILYFITYAAIVAFFPFAMQDGHLVWTGFTGKGLIQFGAVVNAFPYISGFFKVALLATFGEMIKVRGRTGSWKTPGLFLKFLVWGLYGMLFTFAFAAFAKGVGAMLGTSLWPFGKALPYHEMTLGQKIISGFSTSLWLNLIFCFPMMLSHDWFNTCINRKKWIGGAEYLEGIDKHVWGSYMLKTIVVFWIPAHTITFCLPPDYRVLMSAFLSLALGFLLTIKPKK